LRFLKTQEYAITLSLLMINACRICLVADSEALI